MGSKTLPMAALMMAALGTPTDVPMSAVESQTAGNEKYGHRCRAGKREQRSTKQRKEKRERRKKSR